LYRYDILVTPAAAGKKLSRIVKLLLETPQMSGSLADLITDFKSSLISRRRFEIDTQIIEVQYRSEQEDEPRQNATTYKIRVQYTNTLSVSQLIDYLMSTNIAARFDDKQSLIQALNIFLNHYSKSAGNLAAI